MSITDYDTVAVRIAQLIIDANRQNISREAILAEMSKLGNDLLDERDAILARMEKELHDDQFYYSPS
jgi:hypothetical protein